MCAQLHFNVQLFIVGNIVHVQYAYTKIPGKFIETKLNATRYNNKYLIYLHWAVLKQSKHSIILNTLVMCAKPSSCVYAWIHCCVLDLRQPCLISAGLLMNESYLQPSIWTTVRSIWYNTQLYPRSYWKMWHLADVIGGVVRLASQTAHAHLADARACDES